MLRRRSPALGLLLVITACGEATPPPAPPPVVAPKETPPPARCTATVDVADLLARHARAFGSADALLASLPRTMRMEEEMESKKGSAELVLDRSTYRSEEYIGGLHAAAGVDATGPWMLGINGVVARLRADEAAAVASDAWFARRAWLTAFDPKRDTATCSDEKSSRVRLRYKLPELGDPEVDVELATGALLATSAASSDGRRATTEYEEWSAADARGVRWPTRTRTVDWSGPRATYRWVDNVAGTACKGVGAPVTSTSCLAPPSPALGFAWPASGIVKVPMKYYLGELSLRVRLGDRDAWALLDSGAGITAVDATTPAGAAFVSTMEMTGTGSSQAIRLGLGEVRDLQIGELKLQHLPAASIPIPALDGFGNRRPEVILGFSIFLGAAVRVDYAKDEVTFAKTASALGTSGMQRVALRLVDGKAVADVTIDGVVGPFTLDTGNSGGVDMVKRWAAPHGFPGQRPTVEIVAKSGAGTESTRGTLFRAAKTTLGPITHDDRLVQIDDPPGPGIIAGLVGNDVFAHCKAVVFDIAERALWLEGPCDRPTPEPKSGWRLTKKESATAKDRPWVIESIVPGGAAEKAGLQPGDRILAVDGVGAVLDVTAIQSKLERADGTKVTVSFERSGAKKQVVLVLNRVLAR